MTIDWAVIGVHFAYLSAGFRWKLSPGGDAVWRESCAICHSPGGIFAISSRIKCQPVSPPLRKLNLFFNLKVLNFQKIAVSWSTNFLVDLNIPKFNSKTEDWKPVVQLPDEYIQVVDQTREIRAISPVQRQQVPIPSKTKIWISNWFPPPSSPVGRCVWAKEGEQYNNLLHLWHLNRQPDVQCEKYSN